MAFLVGAGPRGVDALTRLYPRAMGYRLESRKFTQEVDTYTVLTLKLSDYVPSTRELPAGFKFLEDEARADFRQQERKLLQEMFDDWDIPYCRKLLGFREDSAIYVAEAHRLVGGAFLCDKNEFDQDSANGQLHYAFIDSHFQGMGIYSVIFREAVNRAQAWGLQILYLNSDRYLLPDVYLRWGAKPWKQITKSSRLPRNVFGNFLRLILWRARVAWKTISRSCD